MQSRLVHIAANFPSLVKETPLEGCFGHCKCTQAVFNNDQTIKRNWKSDVVSMWRLSGLHLAYAIPAGPSSILHVHSGWVSDQACIIGFL